MGPLRHPETKRHLLFPSWGKGPARPKEKGGRCIAGGKTPVLPTAMHRLPWEIPGMVSGAILGTNPFDRAGPAQRQWRREEQESFLLSPIAGRGALAFTTLLQCSRQCLRRYSSAESDPFNGGMLEKGRPAALSGLPKEPGRQ